jgi:hypothetical protein
VITREQVMLLLLAACPSFRRRWESYVADGAYEEGLLYVDLGIFADHLVDLLKRGETSEFEAVFEVVERLHVEGHPDVKEAATIGLLEGLQNVAGHSGLDPQQFVRWLEPESARWWAELNDFWDGKSSWVGAGLERKRT